MPASTEIRFKIGADTSALQRGFVQAQSIAATAGKQLERKLGMKDAFKASAVALGLDVTRISDSIARAFAGMPEWAEQAYQRIVAAGERATQTLRRQISERQTAAQQIATLEGQTRRESRAGGMKEQTPTQRVLSQLPVVGGFFKNAQEKKGIYSSEERIAAIGEESADNQERAAQAETLRNQQRDQARTKETAKQENEIAGRRASGQANGHEMGQYLALVNQELSLKNEIAAKDTSAARREQLELQLLQNQTKQLEMRAHTREAERAAAEKIQDIDKETAAMGESHGQRITRLKKEALELDNKARDQSRSEDERRALRVQSAEKMAAAAKEEYDWRVRTASIADSTTTPTGRRNTTEQGTRARQATKFRAQAARFRANGQFGAAAHYTDLANQYEDQFNEADTAGMKRAYGSPSSGNKSVNPISGSLNPIRGSLNPIGPVGRKPAGTGAAAAGDAKPVVQGKAADRLAEGTLKKNEYKQLGTDQKLLYQINIHLKSIDENLKPKEEKK